MANTFAEDVAAYGDTGWKAMEVWLTKLEKHLEQYSIEETKELLQAKQIQLVAAAYQGGLLLSQGEARKAHFDHFKRRLEVCQQFQIPTLLVVADFQNRADQTAIERSMVSLKQAAQWAAGFDVRLGLEFRGTDTFCTCLDTAITLVEQCREMNVGVVLDTFHFYKGPSKMEDLRRLSKENLAHVQLSDVAGIPRELMTDADRIMPGEGDFFLEPILLHLKQMDYLGWISLELMNPTLWTMKATQVAELAHSAMMRLLK